jgi:hypothetical protein
VQAYFFLLMQMRKKIANRLFHYEQHAFIRAHGFQSFLSLFLFSSRRPALEAGAVLLRANKKKS